MSVDLEYFWQRCRNTISRGPVTLCLRLKEKKAR